MSFRSNASVVGRLFVPVMLLAFAYSSFGQTQNINGREFFPGTVNRIEDLPVSQLRSRLEALPPQARARGLSWLGGIHFTEADLPSLKADDEGGIYFVCEFEPVGAPAVIESTELPGIGEAAVPVSPFPSGLVFHSRPGAENVLYLNFAGETVTGTAWNSSLGRTTIPAVAFSTDSDYSTFSDSEQLAIKRVWQRVAEDYAPFNIDVTTERPSSFDSRTAHALITRNTDANGAANPSSGAGGVAYINVFATSSYGTYRPAWIYHNNLANNESYIGEATSHEIGHNMGLSHDGKTDGTTYYNGHGTGEISWGPLMGTGYNRNVSQWSKGDYYLANNSQDDLAIIAGKLSYRTDDHGNTRTAATPLSLSSGTNVVATNPETDPDNLDSANKGVLERSTDVDVFSFITGSGPVQFSLNPWVMPSGTRGGNVDLILELYNENGTLLSSVNPATATGASIDTTLTEGRYYLQVRSSGAGDPFSSSPSGYTVYGSIGQYYISGYVTESTGLVLPPVAEFQGTDLDQTEQSVHTFTVTYSDAVGINIATIDSNDLRVTGPNDYDQPAQLVSINRVNNGSPCVATYSIQSDSGSVWSPVDNGNYAVSMQADQVGNTQDAYVVAGELGSFNVSIPMVIYSEHLNTDPTWTLEGQWEYGTPAYTSSGPDGGYTGTQIIAYNLSGDYENKLDPTYLVSDPIDCSGSTTLTLRFRRWLQLNSGDTATIEVSANGSTWYSVWSGTGVVMDNSWQLVQYDLPQEVAGSSSLRLRWGISSNAAKSDIGWNIDDIEIIGDSTLDTIPPVAVLNVLDVTSDGSPSHSCSVVYSDNVSVQLSSLDGGDLLVTGPNGYSNAAAYAGSDLSSDGTPCTANYSIPAPQGTWQAADNGTYEITLQANEVQDIFNNTIPQTTLGTFTVEIPADMPGQLEVSPVGGLSYTGLEGGPFTPNSIICVLTNSGGSSLDWTVTQSELWVDLAPVNGTLAAGEVASVTVSVNATAASLSAGSYSNLVSFNNITSGLGNTDRNALLTVAPLPVYSLSVVANQPAWGSVNPGSGSYTGGSNIELTAIPSLYYQFNQWTGDVSSTANPLPVIINSDLSLIAVFEEVFTTNHPTPYWWLAEQGYTNNFDLVVTNVGVNGMKLWESFVAGLDPNDPASQLRLTIDSANPDVLSWDTVTGRTYTVYWSTNSGLDFTPLESAIDLPSTVEVFTNEVQADVPAAFYRLEVRKP